MSKIDKQAGECASCMFVKITKKNYTLCTYGPPLPKYPKLPVQYCFYYKKTKTAALPKENK